MNISAIVPVWNGRDCWPVSSARLDTQTLPAAELLVIDNGSTDGAPDMARARGARVIAMGRNAGFAAAVNRGIREAAHADWIAILNYRCRTGARTTSKSSPPPARRSPPARSCSRRTAVHRRHVRPDLPRRHHLARRHRTARRSAFRSAARHHLAALDRRSLPCRASSNRSGCSKSPSSRIWRMSISGCAAPPGASPAATFLKPVPFTWAAQRSAAGIPKPCAASRAINSSWPRVTTPIRHLWPILVAQLLWGAVAFRHGPATVMDFGVNSQGIRRFSAARVQNVQQDAELLEHFRTVERAIHSRK